MLLSTLIKLGTLPYIVIHKNFMGKRQLKKFIEKQATMDAIPVTFVIRMQLFVYFEHISTKQKVE